MVGKLPAPWFLEVEGRKQGPYTSQEIMKLVMDSALKVESKIFDSASNSWKIAADVIPYLDLGGPTGTQSIWQPPARPTELKDIHVVDLNSEVTGGIDYFALINDRKKELDRVRSAPRQQPREDEKKSRRQGPGGKLLTASRKVTPAQNAGAERSYASGSAQGAEPGLARATAQAAARSQSEALAADGILSAERTGQLGIGRIYRLTARAKTFAREHKTSLSAAAALAFVFVGTYGVVRTMAERKGREPATTAQTAGSTTAPGARGMSEQAGSSQANSRESNSDALGSGKHHVSHMSGGVSSFSGNASMPHAIPAPAPGGMPQQGAAAPDRRDDGPPRDPPQFVSSADLQEQQYQQQQPQQPQQAPQQPQNMAPEGTVQPPGFMTPAQGMPADPNAPAPDRMPTSDPNQPVTPYQ
jgi:hypothetical protein